MDRRIVYTRHDGGVSICCPSPEIMALLSVGEAETAVPRGTVERRIEREIALGVPVDVARRFVLGVVFGGLTSTESWAIIRDRDCVRLGTAHELVRVEDLPADRWFRNAWSRSHNGGPIGIDMKAARRIQFAHIKSAVDSENKQRQADIDGFDDLVAPNWGKLRDQIRAADDGRDLRRVWPVEMAYRMQAAGAAK